MAVSYSVLRTFSQCLKKSNQLPGPQTLFIRHTSGLAHGQEHTFTEQAQCPMTKINASKQSEGLSTGKKGKDPPGPKSLPVIGTIYKYLPFVGSYNLNDRQSTDVKKFEEYGPVVMEEIFPGQKMFYIYDPKLFQQVFQHEGKYPFRFEMIGVDEYRKSRDQHPGFPNSRNEEWYKIRQATNKLTMRPGAVRAYLKKHQEVTEGMVDLLSMRRDEKGEVTGMMDLFYRWCMEGIGVVIFDTRLGTLDPSFKPGSETDKFIKAANEAFTTMYDTTFYWPLHKSKKTKTWKRLCNSFDYISELTEKYMDSSLHRASESQETDSANFLQTLSTKSNLNKQQTLAVLNDLFYASVDTVAHTLTFTLYHLSKNKGKQDILFDEISQHAAPGTEITSQILNNMKYLKAVIKESFRLSPVSAFGVARTFDKDFNVDGYHISAGSTVFLQPNVAAVSEEYFKDAKTFKPERWLRDAPAASDEDANSFPMMAFGAGTRICPGKRFAEQELYLGLITILQKFKLDYKYEDFKMKTRFTNEPDRPLRITFSDRTESLNRVNSSI